MSRVWSELNCELADDRSAIWIGEKIDNEIRDGLKEGSIANGERDLEIVSEWFDHEEAISADS